jgi:hypothetical protein
VRHIRALGGQTEVEQHAGDGRAPEALPQPPSVQEEAIQIAERLAALVESRRTQQSAANPATRAPGARGGGAVGGVVGARHSGRLLGNLLVTRGFLVEAELDYALARQASAGDPIGEILVDLGLITERDLVELLAEQLRMEVVSLDRIEVDRALLALVPPAEARRRAALPLRRVDGHIEVAIADPSNAAAIAGLMVMLGAPLRLFLATRADIDAAVDRLYG